jgi:hypothetical protein
MMPLSLLAQLPPLDPAVIAKQDITGILAIWIVCLIGLLGLLWREYVILRGKYDKLLDDTHTCILQNTTTLNALREQLDIYPTIQRLEDRLGNAPDPVRTTRK